MCDECGCVICVFGVCEVCACEKLKVCACVRCVRVCAC